MSDMYCEDCGGRLYWGHVPFTDPSGTPGFVTATFCPECDSHVPLRSERRIGCHCTPTFVCDHCREDGHTIGVDENPTEAELHALMQVRAEYEEGGEPA